MGKATKNMASKKTRLWLVVGFACGICALAFVGFVTLTSANEFVRTAREVTEHERVLSLTAEIQRTLTRAETDQRGYLLTGKSEYLSDFKLGPKSLAKGFQELRRSTRQYDTDIAVAEELAQDRWNEMESELENYRLHGLAGAQKVLDRDIGLALMTGFRDTIGRVEARQEKELRLANEQNLKTRGG